MPQARSSSATAFQKSGGASSSPAAFPTFSLPGVRRGSVSTGNAGPSGASLAGLMPSRRHCACSK
eukprot:6157577-Pyramimonas_sp.AAC.1